MDGLQWHKRAFHFCNFVLLPEFIIFVNECKNGIDVKLLQKI